MSLEKELHLTKGDKNDNHMALLSLVRTTSMLLRYADRFFSKYGVSDMQFNILNILNEYGDEGMNQQELSEKLVVTKSNVVGLIDRLERANLVIRKTATTDRRSNQLFLTAKGRRIVEQVYPEYFKEVDKIIGSISAAQKQGIILGTEKIRSNLKQKKA